jgi:hypothetical protein
MNEHREPLSREAAERLLDGRFAAAGSDVASLASLLASAASAPQAHELAGEDAALTTFRAAERDRSQRRGSIWRRLITFKLFAAVGAVTAGGLAFASSTGMLPGPFSLVQPPPPAQTTQADGGSRPALHPDPSAPTVGPSDSAEPVDSVAGLCNAYLAKPMSERGKALDTPMFAQLIIVAGGANKVDGFCEGLEADKVDKSHSPRPSHRPE